MNCQYTFFFFLRFLTLLQMPVFLPQNARYTTMNFHDVCITSTRILDVNFKNVQN